QVLQRHDLQRLVHRGRLTGMAERTPNVPNTKLLIGAGAAGLAALAAAGVATGVLRGAGSPSSQPDVASPDAERAIVASFPAAGQAHARALVLQRTPDGYVCLWDSPDGSVAKGLGGCNPAS